MPADRGTVRASDQSLAVDAVGRVSLRLYRLGSQSIPGRFCSDALRLIADAADLAAQFAPCAATLAKNESAIVEELNTLQGQPMDIGGYYQPNEEQAASAMRPCAVFNEALATLG